MKLSNKAIEKLTDRKLLLSLAFALDFSEQWMRKVIEANKENGPLTTAKAVQVINIEGGLELSEILEETSVKA